MATNISTLSVKFTADTTGLKTGAAGAGKSLSGLGSSVGQLTNNFGGLGGRLGALTSAFSAAGPAGLALAASLGTVIAAGYGAYKAIEQFNASANRIDTQSKVATRLGLTYEAVQNLGFAANRSGVDINTVTKAMEYMNKTIGGGGLSQSDRFAEQVERLAKIKDPALRYAEGYNVFGRSVGEIIPLLGNLTADLQRAERFGKSFGLGISELDSRNIERMNDAWGDLVYIGTQLADKFVSKFGGPVAALLENAIALTESWANTLGSLGVTWDDVGGFAMSFVSELNSILVVTNGLLSEQAAQIASIAAGYQMISAYARGNRDDQKAASLAFFNARSAVAIAQKQVASGFNGVAASRFADAVANGGTFESRTGGGSGLENTSFGGASKFPQALEFGSAGAVSAIQQQGGNPMTAVADNTRKMAERLDSILDIQRRQQAEQAVKLGLANL